jgi:hypothetical protein
MKTASLMSTGLDECCDPGTTMLIPLIAGERIKPFNRANKESQNTTLLSSRVLWPWVIIWLT